MDIFGASICVRNKNQREFEGKMKRRAFLSQMQLSNAWLNGHLLGISEILLNLPSSTHELQWIARPLGFHTTQI